MISRIDSTKPEAGQQRRRAPRRRMLKHVQVLSLDKKATSAIDVTLRNTSSSGAQLFGPAASLTRIPDDFYLVAPGQLRMIQCKVVWKGQNAVGVRFLSEPGSLISGHPDCTDAPNASGEAEPLERLSPPEQYYLDRTLGAVLKFDGPVSCSAPESAAIPDLEQNREIRELERAVSEALGRKVEIAGAGRPECRLVVHVQTMEELNEVCRRLSRQD